MDLNHAVALADRAARRSLDSNRPSQVLIAPEFHDLPGKRFRWVWLVKYDPDFFIECRYAGGETIQAHVPSSATTYEMRAHKLDRRNYRPYSITCR